MRPRIGGSRRRRIAALCAWALVLAPVTVELPRAGVADAARPAAQPFRPARPPANTASIAPGASSASLARLQALVRTQPRGYTSVAVFDSRTRKLITAGVGFGMLSASVAKVQLLESLLLKHQRARTPLTRYQRVLVTRMIEHSDNSAADAVFAAIGGHAAALALEPKLGLNATLHHLGADGHWGITKTGAAQEVVLLKNIVSATSPLSKANRDYALFLMRHVEADQRWGVPVVADPATRPAVKNGWLSVIADHGRWAVNSVGLVRVHTHLLAVAVMTQHASSYSGGVRRVESLVRAVARAAAD